MVVRYMGTKRHLTDQVVAAVNKVSDKGRVIDLFSGMGSVAESLQDTRSVITNDAPRFTGAISRARFTGTEHTCNTAALLADLTPAFEHRFSRLRVKYSDQLTYEDRIVSTGTEHLASYMRSALHAANDLTLRECARRASLDQSADRYCLATLYFSAGYFSLRQSMEIDAVRYAIEVTTGHEDDYDLLLSAWLIACSKLINAPGHTAQFLKPNTSAMSSRILTLWRRCLWEEFCSAITRAQKIGSEQWRKGNEVRIGDALELMDTGPLSDVAVIYADPPYTKDQYSRYYHVYETLFCYDFPDAKGQGRARTDKFSTGFCLKTEVVDSFHDLCRNAARRSTPLILRYPSEDLLHIVKSSPMEILANHFKKIEVSSFPARHSTMGASNGHPEKHVTENIYVCSV